MRTLYKYLVQAHPPAFRRQFAPEMLWIFDEASQSGDALSLCCDCLVSLVRQWVLRSGSWKLAVAVIGACLQIMVGGWIGLTFQHTRSSAELLGDTSVHAAAMSGLMRLILWLSGAIVLMVIAASLWAKSFMARRIDREAASILFFNRLE